MSKFSDFLEKRRREKGISKQVLARSTGLTTGYVSHLTLGTRKNPSEDTVLKLAAALEFDDQGTRYLFEAAGLQYRPEASNLPDLSSPATTVREKNNTRDWDGIPTMQTFFGRNNELEELTGWIENDSCQLVFVSGLGGIGKTMLTIKLARTIESEFDYVFWRSLKDAPPFEEIVKQCLELISDDTQVEPNLEQDEYIQRLLDNFKTKRCLLILDNLESLLQDQEQVGEFREHYEGYRDLIETIGRIEHESCLIITTRELPKEITLLAGKVCALEGLKVSDGLKILEEKGLDLTGQAEDAEKLVQIYAGNPLALKVAAEFVRYPFAGDIALFLASGDKSFRDIQSVLKEQFQRLSPFERQIMYWLAIEREAIAIKNLRKEFTEQPEIMDLAEALDSLRRRSLIEVSQNAFILQPVILEFITKELIAHVIEEIEKDSLSMLLEYALIKASAKDYVREAQTRLILEPVAQQLRSLYGRNGCEEKLKAILCKLHEAPPPGRNYAAGNLLNLLIHLGYDLSNYDFSSLYIRQAYLQRATLKDVNFSETHLESTTFMDAFTSILSVAISPDDRLLAAGIENGNVRLWDLHTGTPLRDYKGHRERVRSVAFTPDGKQIVSGSEDYTIRIWSVDADQALQVLLGHTGRVRSVVITSDGERIISGSDDRTIRIWDRKTGSLIQELTGHEDRVRAVAVSSDGRFIASGAEDAQTRVWDAQSGECLKILSGHSKQVLAVNFSPDGTLLASGGEDGTVCLWNMQNYNSTVLSGHENQVRSVSFSPDGETISSSSDDTTIRLWDTQNVHMPKILRGHLHRVYSCIFSHTGTLLVSGSEDQTIRLWDIDSTSGQNVKTLQGYVSQVRSVAFHPSGELLVSGGDDHLLRLWKIKGRQQMKVLHGHSNGVRSVVFNHTGEIIASGSDDRTIRLWSTQTEKCLRTLRGHTDRIRTVAFNSTSTRLASGGEDHIVRIWDVASGQSVKLLKGHADWVRSVAFSPDGSLVASGGEDYTVRIWDVESGKCLKALGGHKNGVRCVAFSPDGTILASSGDDETIRLWDTTSWQEWKSLQDETRNYWIIAIAFSPNGILLASAGEHRDIRLWEITTGRCLEVMKGHEHRIYGLAYHPDSSLLASGSLDGTIRLWDVETGDCTLTLRGPKPYEGLNLLGAHELTDTQRSILRALGAIVEE